MPTLGRTCSNFCLLTGIGSWPAKAAIQPVAASLTSLRAWYMSVTGSLPALLRASSTAMHYDMLAMLTLTSKLAALIGAAAAGAMVTCRTCQDQATAQSPLYTLGRSLDPRGCAASGSARGSHSRSPTACAVRTGPPNSGRERMLINVRSCCNHEVAPFFFFLKISASYLGAWPLCLVLVLM